MPAIPQYQQRTQATGSLGAGPTAPMSNGIGEGLQAVGQALRGVEAQRKLDDERQAAGQATETLARTQSDWLAELEKRKREAPAGAENFTPSVLTDYDKSAAEVLNSAPTQQSRQYLQERLGAFRLSIQREAMGFEAQRRVQHQDQITETSVDLARGQVQANPDIFPERLAELRAGFQGMGMEPTRQEKAVDYATRALSHDAVLSLVDRDPKKTLALLNTEPGKAGVLAVDALDPQDRIQLRNAAEVELHRREAVARQLIDHREAVADRALNEIDRQIASGVPATPEMWSTWESKVRGTSLAPEFRDRVQSERETQALLRKPIDEQVKAVQDRVSALDMGGGSLRDLANLQRLQTAVQKNVETLQKSPLIFNANRTGQIPQPVDITQMGSPEGQQAAAETLSDRVATIQGMRRQYGGQVAMQPLLPQEAAQLKAVVNQASPQQLTGLFANLHQALGNDEAYRAVMQQIAPDSPVRAFAGILAARPRTNTINTRWFMPNDTVSSTDAAQTLLAGEAILHPPKSATGADGNPKVKLYLPEDKSLQDAFQSAVGTAFADRPDAAQNAYQAIKAYYVGQASKQGRLAANGQDIDNKILKQAVRSVLGEVVDVNGRGQVLAPWGMNGTDFTNVARLALQAQQKSVNWPNQSPLPFDALGLRSAGANAYYVTAGRTFLQDTKGNPVVLQIGDAK